MKETLLAKNVHDSMDAYLTLQDKQHHFVGISLYTLGIIPLTNTKKDRIACERVRDFSVGW